MQIRTAVPADVSSISALHVFNWRRYYRGDLSDDYLDGPAEAERLGVWTDRLGKNDPQTIILVAEIEAKLAGFICVLLNHDSGHGHLIDNLHVADFSRGGGVGRKLMARFGESLPTEDKVYLFVLASNAQAIGFYDHLGGRRGPHHQHSFPGGGTVNCFSFHWTAGELVALVND